jgi:hypothetical protein
MILYLQQIQTQINADIRGIFMKGIKSTFAIILLAACLSSVAQAQIVKKAFVWDITESNGIKHGNIYLVLEDGTQQRITSAGNCSKPQIAPDHQTVGWRVGEFLEYRDENPTPYWETSLAFYRNGNTLKSLGPFENRSLIGQWQFLQNGTQAALRRYGMHGQPAYELWDVLNGRSLATWEQFVDGKQQTAPAWIGGIEDGE